jgi:hypothetical protein
MPRLFHSSAPTSRGFAKAMSPHRGVTVCCAKCLAHKWFGAATRTYLTFVVALFCGHVAGAALEWPSAACSGTLQACLNAAAAGDSVQIVTEAIIDEDISINKSLSVFARGTAARFGTDRGITLTAINNGDAITLDNLWLTGPIRRSRLTRCVLKRRLLRERLYQLSVALEAARPLP